MFQQAPTVRLHRCLAVVGLALSTTSAAWSCGFENPGSVTALRGMMNLAFPQSAYVRNAVWQAQMAGDLPRHVSAQAGTLPGPAAAPLQLLHATTLVKALAARLPEADTLTERPALALVLMGPMLWSRIDSPADGAPAQAQVHVNGPVAGDVVLVSDTPALEALVTGSLSLARALDLGLVRLYGPQAKVAAAQSWLAALSAETP